MKLHIKRQVTPFRVLKTLPEILRHVRQFNKAGKPMTQGEVATALKVPTITYRSWESGLRCPSSSAVADIEGFIKAHLPDGAKFETSPANKKVAEVAAKKPPVSIAPAKKLAAKKPKVKSKITK